MAAPSAAAAAASASSLRSYYSAHRCALELRSQQSLAQERFASNGVQKIVHVVVKNQPFQLELGFAASRLGSLPLDFNHVTINAELVYDNEDLHRVDFVKKKPIEFKAHIADPPDRMTIDMRMKVLSSQLEDMHFRLRLSGHDTFSKQPIEQLVVYSEPIKVVSKPEQVHKIQMPTAPRPSRKRKAPADVEDILLRIEHHQAEQRDMLAKLLAQRDDLAFSSSLLQHCIFDPVTTADPSLLASFPNNPLLDASTSSTTSTESDEDDDDATDPSSSSSSSSRAVATSTSTTSTTATSVNPASTNSALAAAAGLTMVDPGQAFESLFQQLLTCYSLLTADERPAKIRKVVVNTPSRDSEKLCELLDQFQYEVRHDAHRAAPSSLMPPQQLEVAPPPSHAALLAALQRQQQQGAPHTAATSSHNGRRSLASSGNNLPFGSATTPVPDYDRLDEFFTREFLS